MITEPESSGKETKGGWMALPGWLNEEQVKEIYYKKIGREPDRIHSPKESATEFWWVGWTRRIYSETVENNLREEAKK